MGCTSAPLSILTHPLLNMSAPPNFTNFAFHCGQGVPSNWTEAHAHSLYDSIIVDPIQCTKNAWTCAHICWVMKSIWFCVSCHSSACTLFLKAFVGQNSSTLQSHRCGHVPSAMAAGGGFQADPPLHWLLLPHKHQRKCSLQSHLPPGLIKYRWRM